MLLSVALEAMQRTRIDRPCPINQTIFSRFARSSARTGGLFV